MLALLVDDHGVDRGPARPTLKLGASAWRLRLLAGDDRAPTPAGARVATAASPAAVLTGR